MAHGKVASYPMETRMAVADALVNGRDYAEIREYLQSAGMTADNLPSDHSLKTFQEGVEYQSVYQDRRDACDLKLQAGRISGCASARVSLVQDRVLLVLERFLEKGLLETAEMLKLFALTLQHQKQELVTAKVRADMGTPVLPEALGPQEFSVAELESIMARLAAAKADTPDDETDGETVAADDETVANELPPGRAGGMAQDTGGSARISEDIGASARIPEDIAGSRGAEGDAGTRLCVEQVDAAIAELSDRPTQDTAASTSISEDIVGSARIPEDIGGSGRIPEDIATSRRVAGDGGARPTFERAGAVPSPDRAGGMAQDIAGSMSISEENGGSGRIPEDNAASRRVAGDGGARPTLEVADTVPSPDRAGGMAQNTGGSASISEDTGGSARIPEDIGGSASSPKETRGFLEMSAGRADADDGDEDDLAVAMSVAAEELNGRRASPQWSGEAGRSFRATPSAETRKKARAKRRKRRK